MGSAAVQEFDHLEAICRAMADPSFYPHTVTDLERRDTHISTVFLTGEWVYKLKKPVDFGFLDFRTLDARRRFCRQEVELNRRLTEGIYEGVVEIRESAPGRFTLDGDGPVVEYAVKMVQLPDGASLGQLLAAGGIDAGRMEDLGRFLAAFYERSERSAEIDHYGRLDVITFNVEENFQQLAPFIDELSVRERWDFICEVSRSFLRIWKDLFKSRVESGRIRDCHGDLRAEHVYFYRGIQIIDCIEFNDRFRYGDVVLDLAFLHMDLEHLGCFELSRVLLAAYAEGARDPELYALLDFYAAYRAVVRLKVSCLRLLEVDDSSEKERLKEQSRGFLDQAYRYAVQFGRPTLWVFCGLPASGKSALASEVARALWVPLFQSDRLRKERTEEAFSHSGVVAFGQGSYRPELRHRIYADLLTHAQESLKAGHSAVLDATFSLRKWRDEALRLAQDCDTNLIFVEVFCPEETIRKRLKERERTQGLSDARLEHLDGMIESFEPLDELPAGMLLRADTERPLAELVAEILSEGYARKCMQVKDLLQKIE